MLFILIACTGDPCKDINCLCPEGTGILIVENVKEASIQKKSASGKKTEVFSCDPNGANVRCSFTPEDKNFQVEVLIGEKSFPVDITSKRKTKDNCCACEYFEFSPHRLTIPYH